MTKAEARRLLGVQSDYALAAILERDRSVVSKWGRMVPPYLHDWIRKRANGDTKTPVPAPRATH